MVPGQWGNITYILFTIVRQSFEKFDDYNLLIHTVQITGHVGI